MLGRVRLDLGAVQRDVAKLDQSRLATQPQYLHKQPAQRRAMALASSLMVRKSGRCMAVTAAKSSRSSQPRAIRREEYTPWL